MDGNPYARMIDTIRGEHESEQAMREAPQSGLGAAPVRMRLGVVTCRVPLQVKVAGIEQPTKALKINERLTKDAWWRVRIVSPNSDYMGLTGRLSGPVTCGGSLSTVTGGELHSDCTWIDEAKTTQLEIDLEVGDEVLLLTEDDQRFYILMKVVDAV